MREITIKLLECLIAHRNNLDQEEQACVYTLAKRPGDTGGAAKYLLTVARLQNDKTTAANYFEQSLASGYKLAELKKSLQDLTALFPSTKAFYKFCINMGTVEEFIITLTKYHELKALSDDEYSFLLEKHPNAADLAISFCIVKFLYDKSKPTARNKLLEISKIFFDKLSIEQHALLVTIYFNLAKFSSFTDYVCFYHALKHMSLTKQQHYAGKLPNYEHMTGYPIMAELLLWEKMAHTLQIYLYQLRDIIIDNLHEEKIAPNDILLSVCKNVTKLLSSHDQLAIDFIKHYIDQKKTTSLVSSMFSGNKDLSRALEKFIDAINKIAKTQPHQNSQQSQSTVNK